jgi:hypothetical protein
VPGSGHNYTIQVTASGGSVVTGSIAGYAAPSITSITATNIDQIDPTGSTELVITIMCVRNAIVSYEYVIYGMVLQTFVGSNFGDGSATTVAYSPVREPTHSVSDN